MRNKTRIGVLVVLLAASILYGVRTMGRRCAADDRWAWEPAAEPFLAGWTHEQLCDEQLLSRNNRFITKHNTHEEFFSNVDAKALPMGWKITDTSDTRRVYSCMESCGKSVGNVHVTLEYFPSTSEVDLKVER